MNHCMNPPFRGWGNRYQFFAWTSILLSILACSCTLHPSMALKREEVAGLAHLARIALNDEELTRASTELESVLAYVDRLQKVPTDGVEEAAPAAVVATGFRPDEAIQ